MAAMLTEMHRTIGESNGTTQLALPPTEKSQVSTAGVRPARRTSRAALCLSMRDRPSTVQHGCPFAEHLDSAGFDRMLRWALQFMNEKEMNYQLETSIVNWTAQIKEILKADPEEDLKANRHVGPKVEVNFWKYKSHKCRLCAERRRRRRITTWPRSPRPT